jgi:hypothetical protein
MNDREFDNHFRKELEEGIKYPFDDKLWHDLSKRLDEHDKGNSLLGSTSLPQGNSGFRSLYWLAPLFLLLLGTNVFYMWNASKTKDDNGKLMSEIKSLKTIIEKRDTIVKTNVIYKTDTIYIDRKTSSFENKTSSIRKQRFSDLETPPSVFYNEKGIKSTTQTNKKQLSGSSLSIEIPKTDFSNLTQKPIESIGNQLVKDEINLVSKTENKGTIEKSVLEMRSSTVYSATDKLPLLSPFVFIPPTLEKQNPLAALNASPIQKPVPFKRLYFGLTGSWLNYQTAWINNAGIQVHKTEQSYQLGLRVEYAFNEHWRLMLGSDYCPFNFDISWKDARYNLPDIPDQYKNYKMKSVKANEQLFNGFLGAKYVFNGVRAKPYLGLAYSAMKILPYDANYTMQNTWNQTDSDVTVPHSGATISNLMMLTGGYEFKIGGRFVAQTEAFMYKDLNKDKKMFDLFGVRATVLARF